MLKKGLAGALKNRFVRAIFIRMLHIYFLIARPLTIGVRGAIRLEDGRVVLVRHSYTPRWHFPGGGLEKREIAKEALVREIEQEIGITIDEEPQLFGVYWNRVISNRDHVLLFTCVYHGALPAVSPSLEISQIGAFALDDLPADIDPGTAQCLREIAGDTPARPEWQAQGRLLTGVPSKRQATTSSAGSNKKPRRRPAGFLPRLRLDQPSTRHPRATRLRKPPRTARSRASASLETKTNPAPPHQTACPSSSIRSANMESGPPDPAMNSCPVTA